MFGNSMMMGGGDVPPLLDVAPNATWAYSTARRLRTGYAGDAFQAGRYDVSTGLGSNTFEAGFLINGELDNASLDAWVGSLIGGVRIFYDQSTNGSNATSRTDVTNGANNQAGKPIYRLNPSPANEDYYINTKRAVLYFAGTLRAANFTQVTLASGWLIAYVENYTNNAQNGFIVGSTLTTGGGLNSFVGKYSDGNFYVANASGFSLVANSDTGIRLVVAYVQGGVRKLRINGVQQTLTSTSGTRNGSINTFGRNMSVASFRDSACISPEVVFYNAEPSDSLIAAIENNMQRFYGL